MTNPNLPRMAQRDGKRILVVDDEPRMINFIRMNLEIDGHQVVEAHSGLEALEAVRTKLPDLILLDVMMPELDGFETLRLLREFSTIPVIMLTAKGEENDKVYGLELGADDYITKPFSPNEVIARVRALLRRTHRTVTAEPGIVYGPISIDVERHLVKAHGEEVKLTAKEFLLLQYLMEHRGRVLSRDLLLSDVWGYSYTGGTRTVDVHVRRLREKVPFLADAIVTVKQFGYKLVDPPPR